MSSLSPCQSGGVLPFPGREVNISSERWVLDPGPYSKAHRPWTPALPHALAHTPTVVFAPQAGAWCLYLLALPLPGAQSPMVRLVEGLILETERFSSLLELSHPNSGGSKVTFQAGSLSF